MYCEDYSELITGYVDGELTDAEVASLTGHLNICGRCLRYLEEVNEVKSLLRQYASAKALSPSLGFSRKVMRNLQRGVQKEISISRKKVSRWISMRPLTTWTAVAAVLLILLAGLFYSQLGVQKSPEYHLVEVIPSQTQTPNPEGVDIHHIDDYLYQYNINDYLYQHAMEVSRTPLTDNAVFVGYLDR